MITFLRVISICVFIFGSKPSAEQSIAGKSSILLKSSAPISLNGVNNQVISQLEINGGGANCIDLSNCKNIVIKNCVLHSSVQNGVHLYKCQNIVITNCYIHDVASGVYVQGSTAIDVNHNQVKNVQGPYPRGQMVQFNNVTGAGNEVSYNVCENIAQKSNAEDAINMYQTNGTAASPIKIIGNQIRGGGPSKTGGGIVLGDNGGSYMIAADNILVNPGQYGIAIASGTNIQIVNNKIFSRQLPFSNVGLFIWNQYQSNCSMNTISGNQVKWINAAGKENDKWNAGNCGFVAGWDTNILNANIDENILPFKIITK
jgi:parallel beta-helix repeat protein